MVENDGVWSGTVEDKKCLNEETGTTIRIHPDGYDERRDLLAGKAGRVAIFAESYRYVLPGF